MVDAIMTSRELKALRLSCGLSRMQLARRLGVDEATYRRMERGTEPIPASFDDELEKIAEEENFYEQP